MEFGPFAHVAEIDRLLQLTWGADDGIRKPFSLCEAAANHATT